MCVIIFIIAKSRVKCKVDFGTSGGGRGNFGIRSPAGRRLRNFTFGRLVLYKVPGYLKTAPWTISVFP